MPFSYGELSHDLAKNGLTILGGFHPEASDNVPGHPKTLMLIGPEQGMWQIFTQSAEYSDGLKDPLDRWSLRTINALADAANAVAHYPFGGPPHLPFYSWALKTGRIWASPVGLLVHVQSGLLVSFRGALAFADRLSLPEPQNASPCETCAKPCLTACPVGALSGNGYDVPSCRDYVASDAADCAEAGCAVRMACPVGRGLQPKDQSRFHMSAFQGKR